MENNHTAEIFLHFAVAFGAEVKSFQTGPIAGGTSIGARPVAAGRRLRTEGGQQRPEEGRGLKAFKRLSDERRSKKAPVEHEIGVRLKTF